MAVSLLESGNDDGIDSNNGETKKSISEFIFFSFFFHLSSRVKDFILFGRKSV